MKNFILFAILFVLCFSASAQDDNPKYNKVLADSLGSDDYGMKPYVLVILKTGTNKTTDKKVIDSLFRGHMDNINRLAKSGQLVVAGPIKKNEKSYRGIFILNVKTIEEAGSLLSTDPAIGQKLLEAETYVWYGSAALPLYLKSHELIEKKRY